MVAKVFVPVRVRISAPFFMYGFSKVLCLNSMQPKSMKYRAGPSHFFIRLLFKKGLYASRFVYIFRGPLEINFDDFWSLLGFFLAHFCYLVALFGHFLRAWAEFGN